MSVSKPIVFVSVGRSGSTIISEIVFRHESLAWPSNYQDYFPSLPWVNYLRRLFENKFWRFYGQKPQLNRVHAFNKVLFKPAEAYNYWKYLTGTDVGFSRGFLLDVKSKEEDARRIRFALSKLVANQGRKRLAFRITGPARIGYLSSIFPDAVFVNVVRNPVATIHSLLRSEFWENRGKHQLWWQGVYTVEEQRWAARNADKPELLAALQ